MKKLICFFVSLFLSFSVYADTRLTETELFYRCYAHLTSRRPLRNNPLLVQVKANKISAKVACQKVLDKALLASNGKLQVQDQEAKAVLKTFTDLHMSFFLRGGLQSASGRMTMFLNDIYDDQGSALYFTRVLFQNKPVNSVLSGTTTFEGIRSDGAPKSIGYSSNISSKFFTYSNGKSKTPFRPTYIETGDLIGVKPSRKLNIPVLAGSKQSGNDLLSSLGGGIVGSKDYLLRSIPSQNGAAPDGANKMNRHWANTVLKDFLCKDLPAVRIIDGQHYKRRSGTSDFRKSDGCIQCHATMDQLAAGGRGLAVSNITSGSANGKNANFRYPFQRNINIKLGSEVWPERAQSNYSQRIPKGTLYFRSYTGELIKKDFKNMSELGKAIAQTDDFYTCIAKKYYEHFTGIKASLADIQDPFSPIKLSDVELKNREKVIALGQELKKTKSTYKLIESILQSDFYRKEAYSLEGR